MDDSITLQQVIQQYVSLPIHPAGTGYYPVLHNCDHGRKGKRAGFKFEDGVVAFKCFNCNTFASYNPARDRYMPKKMARILSDFSIPESEWNKVVFNNYGKNHDGRVGEQHKILSIEPQILELPSTFYYLSSAEQNDSWAELAKWYLSDIRGISPDSYPFMLSKHTNDPLLKKWCGRLIIPTYKNNNLIFYQGRDLTGTKIKKYESPPVSKTKVLHGFDELFKHVDVPLYIIEGVFDAMSIGGVAIFGNKLSEAHIAWLNRSSRKKVYVPDTEGDGYVGAKQALELGWDISIPDTPNCKDMNEAVNKYGKLYVLKSLADNTCSGFEAEVKLNVLVR